jgi:hypothetical protein
LTTPSGGNATLILSAASLTPGHWHLKVEVRVDEGEWAEAMLREPMSVRRG